MIATPDSAHGSCVHVWQVVANAASGASLAPKSTVLFVMAVTPPPEPLGLAGYVTVMPRADWTFGIHLLTSGATNVLPSPWSVADWRAAPAAETATTAMAAVAATASEIRTSMPFFGIEFSSS